MELRPLGDRIIVRPAVTREMSDGGVHIPDTASERPQEGIVLALGPDAVGVKLGEIVVFSKYMGMELKLASDQTVFVLPTEAVIAIRDDVSRETALSRGPGPFSWGLKDLKDGGT
jgi:chaperonin GroES